MNFWWVNLGETYKYEVKGFMWSPQLGARGPVPAYENMKHIRPGDVIFAFADTFIKAIGVDYKVVSHADQLDLDDPPSFVETELDKRLAEEINN
jgi:hypothetical protein